MKTCKHPTCGSKCRRVKPAKKIRQPLKRTPIKKVSSKQQSILGERKLQSDNDKAFFSEIWEEREHVDFETNKTILGEPLTLYFHHVLPKGQPRYKRWRYAKWNIVIVSWETHSKTETKIESVPRIKAYRDFLIKNLEGVTELRAGIDPMKLFLKQEKYVKK